MKKFVLIAMLLFLFGCGQSSAGTSDMIVPIEDELGITPYLPETDYPIGFITIEHSQLFENGENSRGEPKSAKVRYFMSTDEKMDDEFTEAWEEQNPLEEIVYGDLYMEPTAIILSITPDWVGELVNAEVIDIAGHEVQYEFITRGQDTVFIFINLDDVNYQIQYQAETEGIEEEAKAFAKEIIENN